MQNSSVFRKRLVALQAEHRKLLHRRNRPLLPGNGIFTRYKYPILTAEHVPLDWRYDMDPVDNPMLLERLGVNAVFNSGAIKLDDMFKLVARVEGNDRKSFFAVAQSRDGISGFEFTGEPLALPLNADPETNAYDMRLTQHQDGWIYGIYCAERRDPAAAPGDTSSATATAAIVRTRDLITWERLPDLRTPSPQQRNVVLHPEFVNGKYLLYTRPQDGFIDTGSGGGICWGLSDSMDPAVVERETVLDPRVYHTIKEVKNGAGAPPIKTPDGWLHLVHGVRNTAAGLRYVIYAFMTALDDPTRLTHTPGGHLIAPAGDERVGDVSNVTFINGAIVDDDGRVLMYYASSDTRMHVAVSSLAQLIDYCKNTPADELRTDRSVARRIELIRKNRK